MSVWQWGVLCASLIFCGTALALHEDVVERILQKVSKDMKGNDYPLKNFQYTRKLDGPLKTNVRAILFSGKLVVMGLKLNGTVDYKLNKGGDTANFSYRVILEVLFSNRYSLTAVEGLLSSGTCSATWQQPVDIQIEVVSNDCQLSLRKAVGQPIGFDVDVRPRDNLFLSAKLHLKARNPLQVHLIGELQQLIASSFNGKKICDFIDC